jgi:hypothetical protein
MTEKHDKLDLVPLEAEMNTAGAGAKHVVVDHFSFASGMAAAAGSIPLRTGQAVGA